MVTSDRDSSNTDKKWRRSEIDGIEVFWSSVPYSNRMSFDRRIRAFLTFAYRAMSLIRKLDGDLVFATSTPLTIAIPAIVASRLKGVPMVFEVRDLWPEVPIALGVIKDPVSKFAARSLEKAAYRNSEAVIALAPGMAQAIDDTGWAKKPATVIPNGADLRLFDATGDDGRHIRTRFLKAPDERLLLYCGALGHVNGVGYLVDLAAQFRSTEQPIRIVIIGDGVEFDQVQQRARDAGLLDDRVFMLGQLPKQEATRYLLASDMTIALFRGPRIVWRDATQNKFFDSLAAGKPIACNFDGWQSKIAETHDVGFSLPPDSPAAAAAQLASRLQDDEWLNTASKAAKNLARNEFSMDQHARSLNEVLSDSLTSFNKP